MRDNEHCKWRPGATQRALQHGQDGGTNKQAQAAAGMGLRYVQREGAGGPGWAGRCVHPSQPRQYSRPAEVSVWRRRPRRLRSRVEVGSSCLKFSVVASPFLWLRRRRCVCTRCLSCSSHANTYIMKMIHETTTALSEPPVPCKSTVVEGEGKLQGGRGQGSFGGCSCLARRTIENM